MKSFRLGLDGMLFADNLRSKTAVRIRRGRQNFDQNIKTMKLFKTKRNSRLNPNRKACTVPAFFFGAAFLILWVHPLKSQPRKYYYRADREIVLEGTIQQAEAVQRYRGRARFWVLQVKDKNFPGVYTVELCPEWFLDWEFQPGRSVKITGALTRMRREPRHVIARKIIYKDGTKELRDKHGFPKWRGRRRKRGPG